MKKIILVTLLAAVLVGCKKESFEPQNKIEETYTSTLEVLDINGKPMWISKHPVYYPGMPGEISHFIYTYRK